MKVLAINGSPRKTGNTVTLLNKALEGATSHGAETELIHLCDLDFRGCRSCLVCKLKDEKYRGMCAYKDELSLVLEKVKNIDALLMGSPIYWGTATGDMRSFFERLMYPYLSFEADRRFIFPKNIVTGFIYTMGASEHQMKEMKFDQYIALNEGFLKMFGSSESLIVNGTNVFGNSLKYGGSAVEREEMARLYNEAFPDYCKKAFDMGARFAKSIKKG